jgi:hypothetical protein
MARRFVTVFLVAFVVCGLAGFEAWPLTGWRLFADARRPVQHAWRAVAVAPDGRAAPIDFRSLPAGYAGDVQVLRGFPRLTDPQRAAVCDAWAGGLRERGRAVDEIRIESTVTDLGDRRGDRGAPPAATLRWTCRVGDGPATVEAAG